MTPRETAGDTASIIISRGHRGMIRMPYLPVAGIVILGIPLAFFLGAATLIALVATATLGVLVHHEMWGVQFSWHMNMARLTVALALIHGLVVYWTFF